MAKRKFDILSERILVQKIKYPNKIIFSEELRERFVREYIKIRSETNSKPVTILKALKFLVQDAEEDYKTFLASLK